MSANVRVLERVDELDGLRPEWEALLGAADADNLFLTWEWLATWYRSLGGRVRLSVLTVRERGELVAIAPLMVAPPALGRLIPFRRLQFLGAGSAGSDYLDVVVRKGRERAAASALAASLAARGLMLELSRVRAPSFAALALAEALRDAGWSPVESRGETCPYVDLRGRDWDAYLASLGREHRYAFRRKLRGLQTRFHLRLDRVRTEAERRSALAILFRLHRARWSGRGGSDGLHTASLLAFHEEISRLALERGWLRLIVLRLDDRPVAAIYGFLYGGRFYFYQSGFDPAESRKGVGVVALGLSIRAAAEEGAREFDFLHGDEAYKLHWASSSRSLRRLEIFPPRSRGRWRRGLLGVRRAASRFAHRHAPGVLADPAGPGAGPGPRITDGAAAR